MDQEEKEIRKIKRNLVSKMKAVETYDVSFTQIIELTAKIIYDYEEAVKMFKKTGSKIVVTHTNKNGSKNLVKNPFYLSIEKLRDDSITYLRELGLTPTGLKKINNTMDKKKNTTSKLDDVLSNFDSVLFSDEVRESNS